MGCYVSGVFMGAYVYADDLLLLAPDRSGMVRMLKICEKFTATHNISFSLYENPAKSKTKVFYVCGNIDICDKPARLQLNGNSLPYVTTCLHLGHIMAQDGSMVHDCQAKRAQYIGRTVDIRKMFGFANPTQVLTAIDKYAGDHYSAMLYNLYENSSTWKYVRYWDQTDMGMPTIHSPLLCG